MKRNGQKFWSVLLALTMLLTLFGGTMLTAQATEETVTVYLYLNDSGWSQAMVYWWGTAQEVSWPGIAMSQVDDAEGLYYAAIPAGATGVVFNEGQGGRQSPDLRAPKDGARYIVGDRDWFTEICEHEYMDGICIHCGTALVVDRTVYFDLGVADWDQVYYYWWSDYGTVAEWPGSLMTHVSGSVYMAFIPSDVNGLLFNNGDGVQTDDLKLPEEGYIYSKHKDEWMLFNGCYHEWGEGQRTAEPTCVTYGMDTYTCSHCNSTMEIELYPYGHDWVDGTCDRCGWNQNELCTIYFDKAFSDRTYVNLYWWADGETSPAWPGVNMTFEGGTVYSAQIPSYATGIIFNSEGFKGDVPQSPDLEMPGDGYLYREKYQQWVLHNGCCHVWDGGAVEKHASCEEDGLYVDSCAYCGDRVEQVIPAYGHSFEEGYCTVCGAEDLTEMYTIFFDMTFSDKEQVNIYWWTESGDIGSWPGEAMVHQGGSIYFVQVPADVQGLIFNDGTAQTADLTLPGDGYLYRERRDEWVLHNGCCHVWDDGVTQEKPSCTQTGKWVRTCTICDLTIEETLKETYHTWINDTCSACGTRMAGTQTVYLDVQAATEEEVRVYWWGASEAVEWPGVLMTPVEGTIYSAVIPETIVGLIFNVGERQTADLALPWNGGGCLYLMKGDQWTEYCEHEYDGATCIHCGNISTGFVYQEDGQYYYQDGIRSDATGLIKHDGVWYYIVSGKLADQTTTLVKYSGQWWYVVNGKVASDMTTLVKYNGEWWYVVKGKIASNTTSLVKYNGEWWYVVKGKIASKTTTLVKYNNEWWYVVNGKIASKTTTLVKYNGEWWYVVKGKIASNTTTLVNYNGGWYYLVKGKLAAKTTTLVKYNGVWYYVEAGKVNFSYTGNFVYNGSTYRIVKGKVA